MIIKFGRKILPAGTTSAHLKTVNRQRIRERRRSKSASSNLGKCKQEEEGPKLRRDSSRKKNELKDLPEESTDLTNAPSANVVTLTSFPNNRRLLLNPEENLTSERFLRRESPMMSMYLYRGVYYGTKLCSEFGNCSQVLPRTSP